ncbi:MAG: hypothetical protein CBB70_04705 [Planctomycetaceae bacterium TMED10]|nr:MAG: hypothetical protein CBB70_04705 [Planctomycetaceae bacterium TMED10]
MEGDSRESVLDGPCCNYDDACVCLDKIYINYCTCFTSINRLPLQVKTTAKVASIVFFDLFLVLVTSFSE